LERELTADAFLVSRNTQPVLRQTIVKLGKNDNANLAMPILHPRRANGLRSFGKDSKAVA
jgi:hypothetical protein